MNILSNVTRCLLVYCIRTCCTLLTVDALEGLMITGVAMGLAHTLLIARDSEKDDKKVLDALPAYPLKK
jgi:hypothetical protein